MVTFNAQAWFLLEPTAKGERYERDHQVVINVLRRSEIPEYNSEIFRLKDSVYSGIVTEKDGLMGAFCNTIRKRLLPWGIQESYVEEYIDGIKAKINEIADMMDGKTDQDMFDERGQTIMEDSDNPNMLYVQENWYGCGTCFLDNKNAPEFRMSIDITTPSAPQTLTATPGAVVVIDRGENS